MPAECPNRTRSFRAIDPDPERRARGGSTWSSPIRRSTSATSTTATTTEKNVEEYLEFSEEWMRGGPPRAQADRVVLPGDRRRVRRRPVRDRPAEDRVPHAQLDHLALHVRPADQEEVRQEPHAHPVFHEEKPDRHDNSPSTPTPSASPAPGRRPTPTPAPIPRASCRTTRGSCARRKRGHASRRASEDDEGRREGICGAVESRDYFDPTATRGT